MNYPNSSTVNTTAKKIRFSSATRALVLRLALLLPTTAALAGEPIPGVDVRLNCKHPIVCLNGISALTGANGAYQFKGLAPGNYDLFVGDQRVQTITVGNQGSISGMLSREPDGKAFITSSGQVGAPIITTRILYGPKTTAGTGKVIPQLDVDSSGTGSIVATPKGGDGKLPGIAGGPYLTVELKEVLVTSSKITENNSPAPSNRGIGVAVGDLNGDGRRVAITGNAANNSPGIWDQGAAGGMSYATAPPPKGEDKELPGMRGGFILPLIAVTTAPPPTDLNGDGKLPGTVKPLSGIPVGLEGDPGSIKASTTTDANGSFHFDKLPAGKYKLTLPGMSPQSVTVGPDGFAGGKVIRGNDGSLSIFDRWGNIVASSPKNDGIKAAPTPFGFGSGDTPGVGPVMSAGPSIGPGMRPSAGPVMGGAMSPGRGPGMGGGPMGGAGAGRP